MDNFLIIGAYFLASFLTIGMGLGAFTLTHIPRKHLSTLGLAYIAGFILWSLWLFLTAWTQTRPYLFWLPWLLSVYGFLQLIPNRKRWLPSQLPWWVFMTVGIGVMGQLFLTAPSGWLTHEGMRFYGINFHDGMWHLALMERLQQPFPPDNPIYAGLPLKGYHYLVDLYGSELAARFHIPPAWLVFRLFPATFSALTGFFLYTLLKRMSAPMIAIFSSLFLNFFGGSFSPLLKLLNLNTNPDESAFWAQQSITTYINLPLGVSLSVMMALLLWLQDWQRTRKGVYLAWIALVTAALTAIKAYAGILAGIALVAILIITIWSRLPKRDIIVALGMYVFISLSVVYPNIDARAQTFIFEPGWFLKTMMEAPDRVHYPKWEALRQVYAVHHNWPRLVQLWLTAFLVFVMGNMGTRCIGWFSCLSFFKRKSAPPFMMGQLWMWIVVIGGLLIPTAFVQAGTVWNTVQFTYYSLFMMNIIAGIALTRISRTWLRYVVASFVIIGSLPSTYNTIERYAVKYQHNDVEMIPTHHLQALAELKKWPDGLVLAPYHPTAYITAFSGKAVYYADQVQTNIFLLQGTDRLIELRRKFEECKPDSELKILIDTYRVRYIFADNAAYGSCTRPYSRYSFLKQIYTNDSITLYETR